MEDEKLVAMANQIASYFRAYPDDEAVAGIKDHIVAFWTPGMRRTLRAHIDAGAADLEPLVTEAFATKHPAAESPIMKETSGPGEVGAMGSDAG
jgi:formate dehydrogenase subunit delta